MEATREVIPRGGWIPGWEFAAGNLLLVWGATKCLQSGSTAQGDTLFDLCTIFWVLAIYRRGLI